MRRAPRASLLCLCLCLAAVAAPARSEEPARRDILGSEQNLYSQQKEELIIRDFFQDRRDGFFVDVGCAWPIRHSTTYYLEKHLGWSGIGIDGLPDYGPWWQRERPRSRFFNFLVTDHLADAEAFYRAGWPGVSSARKDRVIGERKVVSTEIQVPAVTLDALLAREGVREIDFLSMDIEGWEPKALAGFEIERFRPELVCVEAALENQDALLAYFGRHGYERIERYLAHDARNWYFRPREAPPPKAADDRVLP
jgi:FkbM family methyltransferase